MTNSAANHELLRFEILKHVERTPLLNNRMAAAKLGCSVKLAHTLLRGMVGRGWLRISKHNSRRWDYFLTPQGIAEKARLTCEFIDFSMRFYHEARKASSRLCRELAESGVESVAFLGAGELAEIAYLGVKEWGLALAAVYDDERERFLSLRVSPSAQVAVCQAPVVIVCAYDRKSPMTPDFLPEGVVRAGRMRWIIGEIAKDAELVGGHA